MTTDHDKLREMAEAHVGVSDVELAPDVILSLLARLDRAERERDEIAAVHAELRAALPEGPIRPIVDVVRGIIAERDEARAERDAMVAITAEDAAACVIWGAHPEQTPYGPEETHVRATRAHEALRAHAAKAKVTR